MKSTCVQFVYLKHLIYPNMKKENLWPELGEGREAGNHLMMIYPKENLTQIIYHYTLSETNGINGYVAKIKTLIKGLFQRLCSEALCSYYCIFSIIYNWFN